MDNAQKAILLDAAINFAERANFHITSFNYFIEHTLQSIIDSNSKIEPVIKPQGAEDFYIKLGKIELLPPDVHEADSAVRPLYPMEARIRDLTYDSPMLLNVSYMANDEPIKEDKVLIGRLPIVVKSNLCRLNGLSREELIKLNEDPDDPGGYFIISGTERVVMTAEDLAPNNILINKEEREGIQYTVKIFADVTDVKVPHTIILSNNNLLYIDFGRLRRVPVTTLLKALGEENDQKLIESIAQGDKDIENTIDLNLTAMPVTDKGEALESIGNSLHSIHPKETAESNIDLLLFPFMGRTPDSRQAKAEYIKYVIRYLLKYVEEGKEVYKDHYANKRLHGENYQLETLFRFIFRQIINDAKYNFERGVRKDRIPNPQYIFTSDQMTLRLRSSLATGRWPGGKVGVTQHLERRSFPSMISNLRKAESSLTSNRENFSARDLHGTHFGRFCAVETPEGANVGLTKNIAIFAKISDENSEEEKIYKKLEDIGVKTL